MNSDESGEKRRYTCVIWPENHETDEKRCVIHNLERKRLGIGGRLASRADVHPNAENPRTLVVSYFTINSTDINLNPPMRVIDMNVTIQYQRSQNWDKGGCYLDPQEMESA
jgi:hypothetical protein